MIGQTAQEIIFTYYRRRLGDNSRYSMRAYARDLKISPSQLSLFMAGKKGISSDRARLMTEQLEMGLLEKDYFLKQVEVAYARSSTVKEIARRSLVRMDEQKEAMYISRETFSVISDWYHLGILQVMQLGQYAAYCRELGELTFLERSLKTPRIELEAALVRLKKLGAIRKTVDGHVVTKGYVLTRNGVPSAAIRRFHRQILQKATVAIDMQEMQDRFLNTSVLSIAKQDYSKIVTEFQEFYQSVLSRYGRTQKSKIKADQVYAMAFQFFKVAHLDGDLK